jgi:septal ring factor EnvC (AmiA/AmiB activator)
VGTTAVGDRGVVRDRARGTSSRRRTPAIPVLVGAFATIALAVAIGSSIVTGNATSGDNARVEHEVSSLRSQLAATNHKLDATTRELAITARALSATSARLSSYGAQLKVLRTNSETRNLWGTVSGLVSAVRRLNLCVPALQRELDRRTVGGTGGAPVAPPTPRLASGCATTALRR